jgi:hypothetical protein
MDERNIYRDEHAVFNKIITTERALRLAITFDEESEVRGATREHQNETIDALPRGDMIRDSVLFILWYPPEYHPFIIRVLQEYYRSILWVSIEKLKMHRLDLIRSLGVQRHATELPFSVACGALEWCQLGPNPCPCFSGHARWPLARPLAGPVWDLCEKLVSKARFTLEVRNSEEQNFSKWEP